MIYSHTFEVEGKTLSLESGRVANQAGGAVLLGMGETVVLGTATMSANSRDGIDFLPLVCDYEERKYSVGKIPGGFIKRGGRPSDKAVLVSRLMDRPIRPLFPKGLRNDVQVICVPLAVDPENPSDALALIASGAALAVSDVPISKTSAGVRVGLVDGALVLFPTSDEMLRSDLDLVVAGHKDAISMVEAGANEVSEEVMLEALKFAHDAIKTIVKEIEKFAKEAGKPKREVQLFTIDESLKDKIKKKSGKQIAAALVNPDKASRESAISDLTKELVEQYAPDYADDEVLLKQLPEAIDTVIKGTVRELIIKEGKRPDGRKLDEVRNIEAVAGLLPRVHGSGLFTRGQTQVLTVLTLGLPGDAQVMDGIEDEEDKRYMHFYNFPPYSVGEVRPLRGAGRREIGHGALAERALRPMVPIEDPEFPYTCLLISEALESNGSTSMASVCGSTLALMDAGVPIKAPVAGIAMGLMSDGKVFKVLTDIQGMEDFCGDMDFKVAGSTEGITALQLDTKLDGIPDKVFKDALAQAKVARLHVLEIMAKAIAEPRDEYRATAPKVTTIQINPEKIGSLIGPGGANIRKITSESGASVDVQQDGRVLVGSSDGTQVAKAIEMIKALTDEIGVGAEFRGRVSRLMGRGALVEFGTGRQGLVPIEYLSATPIRRPDDAVKVGDEINVKVYEVDGQGRMNLTALGLAQDLPSLAANEDASHEDAPAPQLSSNGGDRGGRGRDRDRGGPRGDRYSRGGDRGDRGDRGNRGERSDRGDRNDRDRGDRRDREYSGSRRDADSSKAPDVPEEFPSRSRGDDDGTPARFRPRR
ncbi:MAG: polyribonucleotide nucleotidyltransferase [Fimbriimonadaceae bacterium]